MEHMKIANILSLVESILPLKRTSLLVNFSMPYVV